MGARRGYDSDPIKAWKKSQETHAEEEDGDEDGEPKEVHDGKGPDYDYLLGMPMWNLTQEKKDQIYKNRDLRNQELKKLQATTTETMWKTDLDEFLVKLDEVEAKERKEISEADADLAKMKKKGGKNAKGMMKMETLPSAHAIRVEPVIADELKIKASKAVAAKERKEKGGGTKRVKKEKDEIDEFDEMSSDKKLNKSLSGKLGQTPDGITKKKRAPKGTGTPRKKGEKKAAAAKATFKFDDSEDSEKSGSDDELHDNDGIKEKKITSVAHSDESDVDEPSSPPKKAATKKAAAVFQSESEDDAPHANGNGHANGNDDSGSDFDVPKPAAKKPAAKKPAKKLNTSDDLFDNMIEDSPQRSLLPKRQQ